MGNMSAIETIIEEREVVAQTKAEAVVGRRHIALCHGGQYVFDGNRVTVHLQPDGYGRDAWWLETLDPVVWLAVGDDLRVHEHRRVSGRWAIRLIEEFESVVNALVPLEQAICDCAENGHAWSSTTQDDPNGAVTRYIWQWCLCCGAEQIWLPDTGEWLIWPADADLIAVMTAGALPRLHGPVVGGATCNR